VLGVRAAGPGSFELALDANCLSSARAADIRDRVQQLSGPESAFYALFGSGGVHAKESTVHGRWPLDRVTLASLANQ
jgi:hypothetical protein